MYNKTSSLGKIHEKTLKLLECDQKKKDYLNYREEFDNASNFKKIYNYPIHIDIEIDNFCNFACTFCPIGQKDNELNGYYKTLKKLDENKIYEILDETKKIGVKSVQFSLVNEPLANKNIFKYVKYASKLQFSDIFFVSNGYLLNEKKPNLGQLIIGALIDSSSPEPLLGKGNPVVIDSITALSQRSEKSFPTSISLEILSTRITLVS